MTETQPPRDAEDPRSVRRCAHRSVSRGVRRARPRPQGTRFRTRLAATDRAASFAPMTKVLKQRPPRRDSRRHSPQNATQPYQPTTASRIQAPSATERDTAGRLGSPSSPSLWSAASQQLAPTPTPAPTLTDARSLLLPALPPPLRRPRHHQPIRRPRPAAGPLPQRLRRRARGRHLRSRRPE